MKRACINAAILLVTLTGFFTLTCLNTSFAAQTEVSASALNMSAPAEVIPFTVQGANTLCYELAVSDVSKYGFRIKSVEILRSGPHGEVLKTYAGKVLARSLRKPGEGIETNTVFIWIRQSPEDAPPKALFHRVRLRNAGTGRIMTLNGSPVAVKPKTGIVLKPFFAGSGWLAWEAASNPVSHHRIGILDFMGKSYLSQRYAIDWLQVGSSGGIYKTDGKSNGDYYCYGTPLLAGSDGIVVDARDGIPENVPNPGGEGETAVPITFGTVNGNYVILKIGDGIYAHYCHMIPGTPTVKIGDQVKAGDVLGKLGNSGNSTAPHLHFQISDSPDTLRSEGLPYVFESYVLESTFQSTAQADLPPGQEEIFLKDYPLNGSLLRFGE